MKTRTTAGRLVRYTEKGMAFYTEKRQSAHYRQCKKLNDKSKFLSELMSEVSDNRRIGDEFRRWIDVYDDVIDTHNELQELIHEDIALDAHSTHFHGVKVAAPTHEPKWNFTCSRWAVCSLP